MKKLQIKAFIIVGVLLTTLFITMALTNGIKID
jgi:hypothetical protein